MRKRFQALFVFAVACTALFLYQNFSPTPVLSNLTAEEHAIKLFRRLAGVTPSLNDGTYLAVVNDIKAGDIEKGATRIAEESEFYSVTVRDFAGKLSTREGTTLAPLSDMVATVVGVVRDNRDARELLTGDYFYHGVNSSITKDDLINDMIKSNDHYAEIDQKNLDLKAVLTSKVRQKVLNSAESAAVDLDPADSAGLLTTRAYMFAHAAGGTNRRIVEYSFKMFLCSPIAAWASTSMPEGFIGREIGRIPNNDYKTKCKSCHSPMDAMRPATAYFDFTSFIKYKRSVTTDPEVYHVTGTTSVPADEQLIPFKFRRATSVFPGGYTVKNRRWENYTGADRFGWEENTSGEGMNDLGQMIAHSSGFRECMVKRVFASVCRKDLDVDQAPELVRALASQFKQDHNLKKLFIKAALRPECIGD